MLRAGTALLILPLALAGCSSGESQKPAGAANAVVDERSGVASPHGHARGAVDQRPTAEIVREQLLGANNGLEIRRWTVLDAGDSALSVLAGHAEGSATTEAASDRLRQNGLRFGRVRADQVEAIVAELGGATMDRNEWHGQVYEWTSLREQPIDSRGTAVAIDGRVRRFDRGEFRLLIRAWTVLMEDGPHLHVELLPQHRLPQGNNLIRLLGQKPEDAGEAFASMALDLQLQAGFAYVLVSESPNVDWPQMDAPAAPVAAMPASVMHADAAAVPDAASSPQSAAPAPPAVAPRPRVGPEEAVGPEAGAPRTLGEVLLPRLRSPPTREILVFVPKIPDALFPPVYESDFSARRHGAASGAAGASGGAGGDR